MTRTGLSDAVSAAARFLVAEMPLGATLERIALLARDALEPAAAVGLTLLDDHDQPRTQVATGEVATVVDQAQYDDGDGPCLTALRSSAPVRVDDVASEGARWPAFAKRAREQGVTAVLAVPLAIDGGAMGVLNAYAVGGGFSERDAEDAQLFVMQAAVVLENAKAYWDTRDLTVSLQSALESRSVIDMAKGKIMAQNDCTPDEAFALLVKASQRENVKLREIARRIVESRGEV